MRFMDFCVRCGAKEIFDEYLCSSCYAAVHPPKEEKHKKERKRALGHTSSVSEGIVQLRNIDQQVVDFAFAEAEKHKLELLKEKWVKNGVDFAVRDNSFVNRLGKTLQQRFGGYVKCSSKLYTQDNLTGKKVYNITMLFKQFPYDKGQEFEYKGGKYSVVSVGKEVVAEDLKSKEKIKLRFSDLEKYRVF